MSFAVLRISKIKSAGGAGGLSAHIERTMDVPNANKDYQSWNFRAAGTGNVWQDIQDKLKENQIREVRKNGVYGIELLMTASPEFFDDLYLVKESEFDSQKHKIKGTDKVMDFMWKSKSWVEKEFGENNLVSMKLHLDEKTPHIHAVVVPIKDGKNGKKKLSAKSFIDGREKLRALQDSFADTHRESGLKRGLRGSKATHTTVKDFYASIKDNPTLERETLSLVNQRSKKIETLAERRLKILESTLAQEFGHRVRWDYEKDTGDLINIEKERQQKEEEKRAQEEKLKKQKEEYQFKKNSVFKGRNFGR
jgi:hypothetical protein